MDAFTQDFYKVKVQSFLMNKTCFIKVSDSVWRAEQVGRKTKL